MRLALNMVEFCGQFKHHLEYPDLQLVLIFSSVEWIYMKRALVVKYLPLSQLIKQPV